MDSEGLVAHGEKATGVKNYVMIKVGCRFGSSSRFVVLTICSGADGTVKYHSSVAVCWTVIKHVLLIPI